MNASLPPDGPAFEAGWDEPLDDIDVGVLNTLRDLWSAADPPPADLTERITFAMTVAALEVEVAQIIETSAETVGVRSTSYDRTETVTFASGEFSVMVTVEAISGSRVHIAGWASEVDVEVEIRERSRTRTTEVDAQGRFAFDHVERGLAHFVFRRPSEATAVITPAIEL